MLYLSTWLEIQLVFGLHLLFSNVFLVCQPNSLTQRWHYWKCLVSQTPCSSLNLLSVYQGKSSPLHINSGRQRGTSSNPSLGNLGDVACLESSVFLPETLDVNGDRCVRRVRLSEEGVACGILLAKKPQQHLYSAITELCKRCKTDIVSSHPGNYMLRGVQCYMWHHGSDADWTGGRSWWNGFKSRSWNGSSVD